MRLLFLSMLAFVFLVSCSLSLGVKSGGVALVPTAKKEFPPVPVYEKENLSFPLISAQSVLATDLDSGTVLYEKNADAPLFPASTTKILTALVAMDYYPLEVTLEVPAFSVEGQKMGLVRGEKIKVEDLLFGLLIFSANDAAETLAANYPGGRETFIAAMNLKAKEYHLNASFFTNPVGLDTPGHSSTARDLLVISQVAMKDETFRKIVATKQKEVESLDGRLVHKLTNINELVGEVEGVLGVKTGWTENARENLVTYLERGDKKVMISLLGSQDRFGETKELIDWIFESYRWEEVSFLFYSP